MLILLLLMQQTGDCSVIDSTLAVLETDITALERIKTHNRIAHYYATADTSKFLFHKEKVRAIAEAENDTLGRFLANSLDIMYYSRLEKIDIVEAKIKESIRLAKYMDDPNFTIGSYYELALLKDKIYQIDSALYYANKVYELQFKNENIHPTNLILIMSFLGRLYVKNLEYEKALDIYYKADKIADGMTDRYKSKNKGDLHQSIANIYLAIGDTTLAIRNLHKTIPLLLANDNHNTLTYTYKSLSRIYRKTKADSSFFYLEKSYFSAKKIGRKSAIGDATNQLGDHWFERGEIEKAMNYYNESLEIFQKLEQKSSIANTKMRIGKVQKKKLKYLPALKSFDEAYNIYKELDFLTSTLEAQKSRSEILRRLGRHQESLIALDEAMELKDSLNQKKYNKDVKEIQTKYETEKKEAALEKQELLIAKQNNERKNLIYGGLGIFSILSLLLWSLYSRFKKNKRISEQEKEIQQQYISELEKEKKILSMSSMIEGQESERKRIAQDLHDGLGGLLTTIKVKFAVMKDEKPELATSHEYHQTNSMIENACSEVRKISHNMMPAALIKFGLVDAIHDIAAYTSDLHIEVIDQDLHPLPETQQIMLYRVIQEFINNTRKHANANNLYIQFSKDEKFSSIYMEDDGSGFEIKKDAQLHGLGLKSMQSRINFIGASFALDSEIGKGTSLQIDIPFERKKK